MRIIMAESHNPDRPDPVGSHHYIELFREAGHECLWLGPAISPLHLGKPDAVNRHRFEVWRGGVGEVGGVKWLVPLTLLFYYNRPLLRSLFAGRHQYRFCLPPLRKQLAGAGFGSTDLLWCAGPVALSLLELVPHRLSCHRLADRLDRFAGIPANVGVLQEELIGRVGFVLATSRSLLEWAREVRGEGVYYLPNGVSDSFFGEPGECPADFPAGGGPVAVYAGTIDTRFDLEVVGTAVREMPGVHFLLIGPLTHRPLEPGLRNLQGRPNFTWLGPRPHAQLPAYLKRCAAGLIPFYLNEQTEAVNPIKYYEYLACGLPVVAPPMPELAEMGGPAFTYRGAESFGRQLNEALALSFESGERENLVTFARRHTWRSRFREIEAIVAEKLAPADGS